VLGRVQMPRCDLKGRIYIIKIFIKGHPTLPPTLGVSLIGLRNYVAKPAPRRRQSPVAHSAARSDHGPKGASLFGAPPADGISTRPASVEKCARICRHCGRKLVECKAGWLLGQGRSRSRRRFGDVEGDPRPNKFGKGVAR